MNIHIENLKKEEKSERKEIKR